MNKKETRHLIIHDFLNTTIAGLLKQREVAIDFEDVPTVRETRILLRLLQSKRIRKAMFEVSDEDK